MSSAPLIPIVLTFNAEPDEMQFDRVAPPPEWTGLKAAPLLLCDLRSRIEQATGAPAKFTWMTRADRQIAEAYGSIDWSLVHYRNTLRQLEAEGDELGLLLKMSSWNTARRTWFQDFRDPARVLDDAEQAITTFRRQFGYAPRAFATAWDWMSNDLMQLNQAAGVACDMSLLPGLPGRLSLDPDARMQGERLDYSQVPRQPFRPSSADFRRPDPTQTEGIVVLPLTSRVPAALPWTRRLGEAAWTRLTGRDLSTRLLLRLGPQQFRHTIEYRLRQESQPYFDFPLRSGLLVSPTHQADWNRSLDYLLTHPAVSRFRFVGAAEAAQMLLPSQAAVLKSPMRAA